MIEQLKAQIEELNSKIKLIQSQCSHPEAALTKKHGSNTGNYDPSSDFYWTDFHCTLCDKRWTKIH